MNDSFASEFRRALRQALMNGASKCWMNSRRDAPIRPDGTGGQRESNLAHIQNRRDGDQAFVDSLACLLVKLPAGNLRCIDVGTGADFWSSQPSVGRDGLHLA